MISEIPDYEPTGFSLKIFKDRYAFVETETWGEACTRVAHQMALAEKSEKMEKYKKRFREILIKNLFVPGGRILYGSGRPNPALLNCFVIGSEDSKQGWGELLKNVTITSMEGGGCGTDYSNIRPDGAAIKGHRGDSSGPLGLMKGVNAVAEMVRAGGGRRCLPHYSLINTRRGLIKISDIDIGDEVVVKKGSYSKVIGKTHTGKKMMLEIKTQIGSLYSSKNHRWAILKDLEGTVEWKEAQHLSSKDFLMFIPEVIPGSITSLPKYKYIRPKQSTTCKNIIIPELDSGMAWFFGQLHGDGCVQGKGNVSIACADNLRGQHEKVVAQLKRFGCPVSERHMKNEKCFKPRVSSKQLSLYLFQFKQPNTSIEIPDFILRGTSDIRVSYIAGLLDADGSAKGRPLQVASSIYPRFLQQVQGLLSSVGIPSFLKKSRVGGYKEGWKALYELNIIGNYARSNFLKTVGKFSLRMKQDFHNKPFYKEQRSFVVDKTMLLNSSYKKLFGGAFIEKNGANLSFYKFIREAKEGKVDYIPIKIYSTHNYKRQESFDLQIEEQECFVTNGMLTHNSALMMSLDLRHPDLLKFLDAKLKKGELTLTNISVRGCDTTKFIEAIKNDLPWELSWKGKYKKKISAKLLWERIVKNTWKSSEPGYMNMELARAESPSFYFAELISSNPCSEQYLGSMSSCLLGHLVLPRFIVENKINWELMGEVLRTAVRFLDNVIDVNHYPLPEQKAQGEKERRIGLGVTGLSDFLNLLGLKYGSEEGNKLVDKLFRFISKQSYEASVLLAAEKGAFPACDPDLHVKSGFVKRMTPKIKSMIREHGIRNTCLLSIAPTGTCSIVSGNCSSGIEPMFAPIYYRTYWDGKFRKKELCFHPLFIQAFEQGDSIKHFISAHEITVEQHLEIQSIIQKHIDGAISKTVLLPKVYPIQQLSDIWLKYLPFLKGVTFYREGSRNYVDEEGVEHAPPLVALPLKEGIELYKKQKDTIKKEAASIDDCPTGKCSI